MCNANLQKRLDAYRKRFPGFKIADLYQSPESRPRQGVQYCPALTTGCSRLWLEEYSRFAHGVELLLLHAIPATREAAKAMKCGQLQLNQCSHRALCKMAGNSMHSACVGLLCVVSLRFVLAE